MEDKFVLFINTINLILLPPKEIGISYIASIQNQLEELEGDYYTFLHKDYILEFLKKGYLSHPAIDKIERIRLKISEIRSSYWNTQDFIDHYEWVEIRSLTIDLIKDYLD